MYKHNNRCYLVVELMSHPLNSLIEKFQAKISEPICKYIIYQTLKGLYSLHKRDMIHRDIKSDNILINKSGILKICDFGLSALLTRETKMRATEIGTPHWTAPEIIDG